MSHLGSRQLGQRSWGSSAGWLAAVVFAAGCGSSTSEHPQITSFAAAKASITAGQSTTLTPVFSGGTGTVDHGVGPVTSGQAVSVTPGEDVTYTLTVHGSGADATASAAVVVVPPPVITSFGASPASVSSGGSTTLTAVFQGGSGVVDHGVGAVTSGVGAGTGALSATTVFTLTVTNAAGDAVTRSTTATVTGTVLYAISGHVTGAADAGVTVTLSGATDATATTDAAGAYAFAGLGPGSYTVTPTRARHAFAPAGVQVVIGAESHPGVDFVATATALELFTVGAGPQQIVAAPDGTLWFTEYTANKIGRLTPSGQLTEYPVPTAASGPSGIAVWSAPAGSTVPGMGAATWALVFTESAASRIGVMNPADGSIVDYPTPTASVCPGAIATARGGGGLAWFVEACDPASTFKTDAIGSVDLSGTTVTITEHALSGRGLVLSGVTVTSDGAVWFTERGTGMVGRYKEGETRRECQLVERYAAPLGITALLDARGALASIAFTEHDGGRIGVVAAPGSYACSPSPFTEATVPTASSQPSTVIPGPPCSTGAGEAAWFTEYHGGKLGCFDGSAFRELVVSPLAPVGLAIGADGNAWFTAPESAKVGRIPLQ